MFVETIKASYPPAVPHKKMPQQKNVARGMDPERLLEKAASFLGADLKRMKNSRKMPAVLVLDRDLMLYLLWQQGHQTNQQTGELFDLTHSAVSRW